MIYMRERQALPKSLLEQWFSAVGQSDPPLLRGIWQCLETLSTVTVGESASGIK